MKIKDNYVDQSGNVYKIRNINYECLEKARFNFGTFLKESKSSNFGYDGDDFDGIYLYKSKYDDKKALRIYKDFMHYKYVGHPDQKIIYELQQRQKFVKFTEFPTGIVTIENSVIGQEIPYYDKYEPIRYIFKNNKYKDHPTNYYVQILKILIELFDVGITYQDIHSNNFLFNSIDEDIKLIDFESFQVKFDEGKNCNYNFMIDNLKFMITLLNRMSGIEFDYNFERAQTLEEIEESILENQKKLIKYENTCL